MHTFCTSLLNVSKSNGVVQLQAHLEPVAELGNWLMTVLYSLRAGLDRLEKENLHEINM